MYWAIIYITLHLFVSISGKLSKKLPSVCASTLSTITKLTHTSHLIADLSHTHAPPHLIKALRAMIGWS